MEYLPAAERQVPSPGQQTGTPGSMSAKPWSWKSAGDGFQSPAAIKGGAEVAQVLRQLAVLVEIHAGVVARGGRLHVAGAEEKPAWDADVRVGQDRPSRQYIEARNAP